MDFDEFTGQVTHRLELPGTGEAVRAVRATLQPLGQRLQAGQAETLEATLPMEIGWYLTGAVEEHGQRFDWQEYVERVAEIEGREFTDAAYDAQVVFDLVSEQVAPSKLGQIRDQLPGGRGSENWGKLFAVVDAGGWEASRGRPEAPEAVPPQGDGSAERAASAPSTVEKGGGQFEGISLLLCENPLPPIDEAIDAAAAELPNSNHYTEAHSDPLRDLLADRLGVPRETIHVNAGSELILRQLFDRFGQQVHLVTPTYPLFPEIADEYTEMRLDPETDFRLDLAALEIPPETTLAVLVNPNNPNGLPIDVAALPALLEANPRTQFLVDEAFVDFVDDSAVGLVTGHDNLVVTRTLSKAHSLAGFRIGYAVAAPTLAASLNASNDAYPLARPSQAAAMATLRHAEKIDERVETLRAWAADLARDLEELGVRTFPSRTYFFLADFAPHDAADVAAHLREREVYVKPLEDDDLGPGYMRVTTGTPEENETVVDALSEILG